MEKVSSVTGSPSFQEGLVATWAMVGAAAFWSNWAEE